MVFSLYGMHLSGIGASVHRGIVKENSVPYAEGRAFRKMIPEDEIASVGRRPRPSQGQKHGQGNNLLEQRQKQGKQHGEEQDHTELLSLWFVRRNLKSPICLRNLEDNCVDFMNMHMIRNKNMDQSVLKKIGKQLMPFVALIASAMFKLEEKFYIVFYMISEWSLGPGYTPEYSVEKFHIVLKEFMLQRIVGCILL